MHHHHPVCTRPAGEVRSILLQRNANLTLPKGV
jgi:hypothetical protein